ncbi:hypothetical protein [Luteitalea sp.]|uniref:hypothetical protein n=1 Tax=Luteitalea sp. TaxID=2004800 RepID=UPI0025C23D7C|nr:hypothetical protein [Luteitalea sp.]
MSMTIVLSACAPAVRQSSSSASPGAPNPNGCYAFIFSDVSYAGERTVVNGPRRISSLATLPSPSGTWDGRIRSLQVGLSATLSLHAQPELSGATARFAAGTSVPRLDASLAGKVRSLNLECRP